MWKRMRTRGGALVKKVYFDPTAKAFVIDGKRYRFSYEMKGEKGHHGKGVFKPEAPNLESRLGKAASYLAKKAPDLTVELMIKEALRAMPERELARLERSIKKKKKPVVKEGCVALEIGGQPIFIVG